MSALDKAKLEEEAHGGRETTTQGIYCVGTLKGPGPMYQQTFIDSYANWPS